MNDFNILLKPSGYTYDYDDSLSAAILNEFATAAFRFHTLIQVSFYPFFFILIKNLISVLAYVSFNEQSRNYHKQDRFKKNF